MTTTNISLRINHRSYLYIQALTIFQACLEKKIYVPRFCYHVALKIAGNCRMCLVEEKSSLKPVASCAVTIVGGMTIFTQTELVKKAREGVIEYLLINHPLDCPICDQGGECDLQDQTMVFGADRGRFYEQKRSTPNKNLGFLVKTFLNRCIHCARCTRFLHDMAATPDLNLLGRGYKTEISTFTNNFLRSEVSGNIIDLCPVGALTSKPYAFKARPWELVSVYMFDIVEPFGSNIEINYRGLELMRVLPRLNYEINEEWISDKTRFVYDSFTIQRLTSCYNIVSGKYSVVSWLLSLNFWKNSYFSTFSSYSNMNSITFAAGDYTDFESLLAVKFFTNKLVPKLDFFFPYDFSSTIYGTQSARQILFVADVESRPVLKSLVVVNVNPRLESPVLNIKLRRLVEESQVSAYVLGFVANINFSFRHLDLLFGSRVLKNIASLHDQAIFIGKNGRFGSLCNLFVNSSSVYNIADSVGTLAAKDTFGFDISNKLQSNYRFFLGQPEVNVFHSIHSSFLVNLLHHIEDGFWSVFGPWNGIKLPVRFYLEKLASYTSESGYFFSTLTNIFGFSIRGTREDWKVIIALAQYLGLEKFDLLAVKAISYENVGRRVLFSLKDSLSYKSRGRISLNLSFSTVNNYYATRLLERISPVLGLCSRVYPILNDYRFVNNL